MVVVSVASTVASASSAMTYTFGVRPMHGTLMFVVRYSTEFMREIIQVAFLPVPLLRRLPGLTPLYVRPSIHRTVLVTSPLGRE